MTVVAVGGVDLLSAGGVVAGLAHLTGKQQHVVRQQTVALEGLLAVQAMRELAPRHQSGQGLEYPVEDARQLALELVGQTTVHFFLRDGDLIGEDQ